ncbi:MAG: hypothetical protein HYY21_05945 [Candidatus Tectomicrobia bacterium]|nr:hypothetical protein [Candidatus Tectomicrobia bacterium]
MERLAKKYAADVAVLNIYVREPHPQEGVFGKYLPHSSYEQKMSYARELVREKDIREATVLVDGIDQKTHETFGRLPNMVYVADREGNIVYKASWTKSEVIEGVIREILAEERGKKETAVA